MAKKKQVPPRITEAALPPPTEAHPSIYRNRIIDHRIVKSRDLIPHPMNWRSHPDLQRQTLMGILGEVGKARSLTAYIADADKPFGEAAPLTLIDGHLRSEINEQEEWTVEVLDLSDEEAKKLLLSMDPLAALAGVNAGHLEALQKQVKTSNEHVKVMFEALAKKKREKPDLPPQQSPKFCVLIMCLGEEEQRQMLERFIEEGLECRALLG